MTRSTSKRNLRIGLVPDPLPRPDSASTHQKILPSNFLPIRPEIASVDQVSPSISKTLPSNLLAISIKIASIHPGSSPKSLKACFSRTTASEPMLKVHLLYEKLYEKMSEAVP